MIRLRRITKICYEIVGDPPKADHILSSFIIFLDCTSLLGDPHSSRQQVFIVAIPRYFNSFHCLCNIYGISVPCIPYRDTHLSKKNLEMSVSPPSRADDVITIAEQMIDIKDDWAVVASLGDYIRQEYMRSRAWDANYILLYAYRRLLMFMDALPCAIRLLSIAKDDGDGCGAPTDALVIAHTEVGISFDAIKDHRTAIHFYYHAMKLSNNTAVELNYVYGSTLVILKKYQRAKNVLTGAICHTLEANEQPNAHFFVQLAICDTQLCDWTNSFKFMATALMLYRNANDTHHNSYTSALAILITQCYMMKLYEMAGTLLIEFESHPCTTREQKHRVLVQTKTSNAHTLIYRQGDIATTCHRRMCDCCMIIAEGMLMCSCHRAWYCNVECQRKRWQIHQRSCMACGHCYGMVEGMKQCSVCKRKQYCSVECQRLDWPKHKLSCIRARVIE